MFYRIAGGYNRLLGRYHYPVTILSAGALWFTGDILCQTMENFFENKPSSKPLPDNPNAVDIHGPKVVAPLWQSIDTSRLMKMTIYGLFFSAPIYAFWYVFLDKSALNFIKRKSSSSSSGLARMLLQRQPRFHFLTNWPKSFRRRKKEPILETEMHVVRGVYDSKTHKLENRVPSLQMKTRRSVDPLKERAKLEHQGAYEESDEKLKWRRIRYKLFADIIIFDPIYLLFLFTVTSLLEGKSPEEIREKCRANFTSTYLIDMAVWFPVQLVNFRFVPVTHQALFVQSVNVFWNAFLSFVLHHKVDDTNTSGAQLKFSSIEKSS